MKCHIRASSSSYMDLWYTYYNSPEKHRIHIQQVSVNVKSCSKKYILSFFLNSARSAMVHRSSDCVFHAEGLVYEKARSQNFWCNICLTQTDQCCIAVSSLEIIITSRVATSCPTRHCRILWRHRRWLWQMAATLARWYFMDSSLSRWTLRSWTTVDCWILDAPTWTEKSVLAIFARLDWDPTHMPWSCRLSTADDGTCTMSWCHLCSGTTSGTTSESTVCWCCQVGSWHGTECHLLYGMLLQQIGDVLGVWDEAAWTKNWALVMQQCTGKLDVSHLSMSMFEFSLSVVTETN